MHHDVHARGQQFSGQQTLGDVLDSIGPLEAQRNHRASQYDRDVERLREFAMEIAASLDHRVRAVRNHDWRAIG